MHRNILRGTKFSVRGIAENFPSGGYVFPILIIEFFAEKGEGVKFLSIGGGEFFSLSPYANVWLALFPTGSKF